MFAHVVGRLEPAPASTRVARLPATMSSPAARGVGRRERAADVDRSSDGGRERWPDRARRDLARPSADERHLGDVGDLLERLLSWRASCAQLRVVVAVAPQRERHDRDVVDRAGLDERRRCARRQRSRLAAELLVQAHERRLFVLRRRESAR